MFMHLIKSLWKRKTKNFMISVEILLIFVVIFAMTVGVVYNMNLYQTPLGFDIKDRWSVNVQAMTQSESKPDPQLIDSFKRSLKSMPEVESLSFMDGAPYFRFAFTGVFREPESDKVERTHFVKMDDDAALVLNLRLVEGRWFSNLDEGANQIPIIINRGLANALFPKQSPIGKVVTNSQSKTTQLQFDGDKQSSVLYKVVGVIEDYRYFGELMGAESIALIRHSALNEEPLHHMVLKLKAGTERNFEIKLHQQLKLIRSDKEYQISTLEEERAETLRQKGLFYVPPVIIALFLLVMVAFGLFGVLWQNTTSRIPEIGLRRAVGASSRSIYQQIVVEQILLCSLAMGVALIFLIQLPLTGVATKFLNWESFFVSVAISMGIIYSVSVICSLYPAWVASRLSPTDALHYE